MSHRRTASDSSAGDYNSAASAHSDWEAEHGDVEGHAGPHPPNGHVASGHALGHGHVHVHAHAHAPHDGLASAEAAAAAAAVAAAGIPGQIAYSVDWHNERQRLPPQVGAGAARRPEERWAAVLALRSAVLAPGTGADDADTVEREARASVLRVRPLRCSVARVQCRAPLPSAFAHHPLVAGPLRRGAGALPARPGLRRARGGDHVPGAQAVAARVWLERGPPHVERAAGPAQGLYAGSLPGRPAVRGGGGRAAPRDGRSRGRRRVPDTRKHTTLPQPPPPLHFCLVFTLVLPHPPPFLQS